MREGGPARQRTLPARLRLGSGGSPRIRRL